LMKNIQNSNYDGFIVREPTSDSSYSFIGPVGKEVILKPVSLGTPIRKITIINSQDSTHTVDFRAGKKDLLKLKKSGIVKTKGFIFATSIIVENKF
jgi:hypothetical protein